MIQKAISIGLAGNKLSKKITGINAVSAGRTLVATGTGAALGAVAAEGTVAICACALGASSAPVTIPLALASAIVSGIASRF